MDAPLHSIDEFQREWSSDSAILFSVARRGPAEKRTMCSDRIELQTPSRTAIL